MRGIVALLDELFIGRPLFGFLVFMGLMKPWRERMKEREIEDEYDDPDVSEEAKAYRRMGQRARSQRRTRQPSC